MDVRCERCRATYVFDDDAVTPSGLTVQCTNCAHVFKVRKKELVVTVPVRPEDLVAPPVPATSVVPRTPRPDAVRVPLPAPDPFLPPSPSPDPFAPPFPPVERDPFVPGLPLTRPPLAMAPEPAGPTVEVDLADEASAAPPPRAAGRTGRRGAALAALAVAAAAAVYGVLPDADAGRVSPAPPPAAAITATVTPPMRLPEPTPAIAEPAPAPVAPVPVAAPPPPPPRSTASLLAEAEHLRARGHASRALDLYGRVVNADPSNAAALAGRGLCYLELERWAPAEASFQAALALDPQNGDALLGLAETYRWQGLRADAIKYYSSYLAAHPDGEDAAAARNAVTELEE